MAKALNFIDPHDLSMTVVLTALNRFLQVLCCIPDPSRSLSDCGCLVHGHPEVAWAGLLVHGLLRLGWLNWKGLVTSQLPNCTVYCSSLHSQDLQGSPAPETGQVTLRFAVAFQRIPASGFSEE